MAASAEGSATTPALRWACPECRGALETSGEVWRCPRDGFTGGTVEGIRTLLTAADRERLSPFLAQYQHRRATEQRGSDDPAFYLGLPSQGPGREWRLRTRSLAWLRDTIGASRGRVLDAGAGCCWLTRHLETWGRPAVALDLTLDGRDGLGAGRHYQARLGQRFERVQATFERLPFAEGQFERQREGG